METLMAERREGRCDRCERDYRGWSASSPLWNAVMRGGCITGEEEHQFLCANCFMELAEMRGIASAFRLDGDAKVPLQTVTPSGRVWNARARLFEQPRQTVVVTPKRRTIKVRK